jgi:hypothetical protein
MLKVSCRDIFSRTKSRLLRTLLRLGGAGTVLHPDLLAAEQTRSRDLSQQHGDVGRGGRTRASKYASWLVVNPLSLEVKVRESLLPTPGSQLPSPSSPSSSLSNDEWGWVDTYTGTKARGGGAGGGGRGGMSPQQAPSQAMATSAEIFMAAESLRHQLESDISEHLLTDVFDPSSSRTDDQDSESASTLARSLQVQCCELVGQVLVLLRVLMNNLSAAIKLHQGETAGRGKSRRSKSKSSQHGSVSDLHTVAAGEASLQSGLLLLSRLAWLLRTSQGTFLEFALQTQQAPSSPPSSSPRDASLAPTEAHAYHHHHHHHHHQQYMTSLEQLQSAFDIADTDGDGIISFAEATEVSRCM